MLRSQAIACIHVEKAGYTNAITANLKSQYNFKCKQLFSLSFARADDSKFNND